MSDRTTEERCSTLSQSTSSASTQRLRKHQRNINNLSQVHGLYVIRPKPAKRQTVLHLQMNTLACGREAIKLPVQSEALGLASHPGLSLWGGIVAHHCCNVFPSLSSRNLLGVPRIQSRAPETAASRGNQSRSSKDELQLPGRELESRGPAFLHTRPAPRGNLTEICLSRCHKRHRESSGEFAVSINYY